MRMLAKSDILENGKKHKTGAEFDTDEATGLVLLRYGWAAEIEPADEKPKKRTTKKKEV